MTDPPTESMRPADASSNSEMEEHSTGLPGFRTWRGVYSFVFCFFVVCVVLLKVFELAFS